MSVGYFLDKEHPPTLEEVVAELGPAWPAWERITRFIAEIYKMPGELSFGGKKYGWNLWYHQGGKSLISMFPHQGFFVAQVILGKDQALQAASLDLCENVRSVFNATPHLHDGKWLYIPARSERDAQDIEKLLLVKKPVRPKKGAALKK